MPAELKRAKRLGLTTLVIPSKGKEREQHDREVVAALQQHKVDLVCLAGYMRLLSPWFVQQFPHRILNIHPSLLPAFPGLEAQQQAFAYGVKVPDAPCTSSTKNSITARSLCRKPCRCRMTDDEHTLAARILSRNTLRTQRQSISFSVGEYEVVGRKLVTGSTAQ